MGMLPEDWLKKYGMLVDLGSEEDGHLRFGNAQAGLLDALLAAQPEIQVDAGFDEGPPERFTGSKGSSPQEAPAGFHGELRPYQCEGLGWLDYLQKFDFGGILADDMGLGKTVQVLALLQRRRSRRQAKGPSLAVVPRSLVFNWIAEASKVHPQAPRARLHRPEPARRSARRSTDYDLIITTYGTLRTDIAELAQFEFDYLILDEAQAIKNADSQAAKAARLLRGKHRLAMSGTPIENHLGELWSIFEFLNPGMLGTGTPSSSGTPPAPATLEAEDRSLAGQVAPAVHPPPDQVAGRQGPSREVRADPPLRHGARPAPALRGAPGALPRGPAPQGRRRAEPVEDRGSRSPLAAPPGRRATPA